MIQSIWKPRSHLLYMETVIPGLFRAARNLSALSVVCFHGLRAVDDSDVIILSNIQIQKMLFLVVVFGLLNSLPGESYVLPHHSV